MGEYTRVTLPDDSYGWVRNSDVGGASAPKKLSFARTKFSPQRTPPSIEFTNTPEGKVVTGETIELSGRVFGRNLRDMFIIVNDKKVFFRGAPRTPGDKATDEQVSLAFQTEVKLKEGLNRILVVGRLDEKVMSYRNLLVSRRLPGSKPIASGKGS